MFKVRRIIPYVLTAAIGVGVGIQIEKHNTDTLAVERLIAPTAAPTAEIQASVSAAAAADTAEETTVPGINADGKININTATSEELQELNGIGPKTAEKIIDDRTVNGAYKNTREITRISGIGDKTYEQIAPYITVE